MLINSKLAKFLTQSVRSTRKEQVRMSSTTPKVTPGTVPAGYKAHTESSTTILVPDSNTAFLNPVQQYNRDLSIAVIRAWNELRIEEAAAKQANKKGKGKAKRDGAPVTTEESEAGPSKPVGAIPRHLGRELMSSTNQGRSLF